MAVPVVVARFRALPLYLLLMLLLLLAVPSHSILRGASQTGSIPSQLRTTHPAHLATTTPPRAPSRINALHRFNVSAAAWKRDPAVSLSVDLEVFESSAWFTLTWHNVLDPTYDDFIALYVPADADITKTAPVKFKFCVQANHEHVNTGTGVARFWLINYRQDMAFVLMRGGLAHPTAVARSNTIRVLNPNAPLQGRLARTQDPTQMLVQWTTHNSSKPAVKWGPHHDGLGRGLAHTAAASSSSYTREDMCGGVAKSTGWLDAGVQHQALLTGLEPGRRYDYSFGDADWGFSERFSFSAAPPPQREVHVLVVADVGEAELDGSNQAQETMLASLNTTRRLEADAAGYSLLLHPGDLSYAEGFGGAWETYFHQITPIATRMPYMVAAGNHERDWPLSPGDRWGVEDSGGECGVPYERRLAMPTPGPDQPWYSFDHGPVHFLQYSTEHAFEPGSPQHAFILSDLRSVNRSVTPWLIVSGHRPIYISSTNNELPEGDQPVARLLRGALERAMLEHHVDLTFAGHHHTYQRTCPVFEGECVGFSPEGHALGPVHVVVGNGGASLSFNVQSPAPAFLARSAAWWGYVRLHASATELRVEAVSDLDGSLLDEFRLTKRSGWGEQIMLGRQREAGAEASSK